MKNKVIILGGNYSSLLGMIRAIGKINCDITVIKTYAIRPTKEIESKSKYISKYFFVEAGNPKALLDLLLSKCTEVNSKPLLIPIMDDIAMSIDKYYDVLKDYFIMANVNETQGGIIKLMDKQIQKKIASKAGLHIAKGWEIEIKNKKFHISESIEYPCFTKAQISVNGGKTFMRKCNNKTELQSLLEDVARRWECIVLVEQYKEIQQEYGVLGCCVNGNVYLPALITKISIGEGNHKGVTLQGKVSSLEKDMPELKIRLESFLKETKYTGLCDFDIYKAEGDIYFNEMNLRYGGFGYAVVGSGVNLPAIYVSSIFNTNNASLSLDIKNQICVSDKVNLEAFINNYISWKEYKQRKSNSNFRFLAANGDPKPAYEFRKKEVKERIKHYIKKILNIKRCILN